MFISYMLQKVNEVTHLFLMKNLYSHNTVNMNIIAPVIAMTTSFFIVNLHIIGCTIFSYWPAKMEKRTLNIKECTASGFVLVAQTFIVFLYVDRIISRVSLLTFVHKLVSFYNRI